MSRKQANALNAARSLILGGAKSVGRSAGAANKAPALNVPATLKPLPRSGGRHSPPPLPPQATRSVPPPHPGGRTQPPPHPGAASAGPAGPKTDMFGWPGWYNAFFGYGHFPRVKSGVDTILRNPKKSLGAGLAAYGLYDEESWPGAIMQSGKRMLYGADRGPQITQEQYQMLLDQLKQQQERQQLELSPTVREHLASAWGGLKNYWNNPNALPRQSLSRLEQYTKAVADGAYGKTGQISPVMTNANVGYYTAARNGVGVIPSESVSSVRSTVAPVGGSPQPSNKLPPNQVESVMSATMDKLRTMSGVPVPEPIEAPKPVKPPAQPKPEKVEVSLPPRMSPWSERVAEGNPKPPSSYNPQEAYRSFVKNSVGRQPASDAGLPPVGVNIAPPPPAPPIRARPEPTNSSQSRRLSNLPIVQEAEERAEMKLFEASPHSDMVKKIYNDQRGLKSDSSDRLLRNFASELRSSYESYVAENPQMQRLSYGDWLSRYHDNPSDTLFRSGNAVASSQLKRQRRRMRKVSEFSKSAFFKTKGSGGTDNVVDDIMWNGIFSPGRLVSWIPGMDKYSPGQLAQGAARSITGNDSIALPAFMKNEDYAESLLGSVDTPADYAAQDAYDTATAAPRAVAAGAGLSMHPVTMAASAVGTGAIDGARPWVSRAGGYLDKAYEAFGYEPGTWSRYTQQNLNKVHDWANSPVQPGADGSKGLSYYARRFAAPYVQGAVNYNMQNTDIMSQANRPPQAPAVTQPPTAGQPPQPPQPTQQPVPQAKPELDWMSEQEIANFKNPPPIR